VSAIVLRILCSLLLALGHKCEAEVRSVCLLPQIKPGQDAKHRLLVASVVVRQGLVKVLIKITSINKYFDSGHRQIDIPTRVPGLEVF
jgi:hypothetical protein